LKRGLLTLVILAALCPAYAFAGQAFISSRTDFANANAGDDDEPSFDHEFISSRTDFANGYAEIGIRGKTYGVGLGFIGGTAAVGNALDYPCPCANYQLNANQYVGGTGVDIFRFYDFDSLSIFILGGIYSMKYADIATSPYTGWMYIQNTRNELALNFGGGVEYRFEKIAFGVDWQYLRGTGFMVGWSF
jgi:hypothetical protein